MKKRVITRTVLLTAALAGTMASCQKDEFSNEMVPSQEMSLKEKALEVTSYTINFSTYTMTATETEAILDCTSYYKQ